MNKTKSRTAKATADAKATPAVKKTAAAKKTVAAKKTSAPDRTIATKPAAAAKKAIATTKTSVAKKTTATKNAAVAKKATTSKSANAGEPRGGAGAANAVDASRLIDAKIAGLADWRGETLAQLREIIRQADPDVVEEWKWGIPVWSHDGILCTGETYKNAVKTTFAHGAALDDPSGLFNSSLDGNTRRAIDFPVGTKIDAKALTALIRAAVALNTAKKAGARRNRSAK